MNTTNQTDSGNTPLREALSAALREAGMADAIIQPKLIGRGFYVTLDRRPAGEYLAAFCSQRRTIVRAIKWLAQARTALEGKEGA